MHVNRQLCDLYILIKSLVIDLLSYLMCLIISTCHDFLCKGSLLSRSNRLLKSGYSTYFHDLVVTGLVELVKVCIILYGILCRFG